MANSLHRKCLQVLRHLFAPGSAQAATLCTSKPLTLLRSATSSVPHPNYYPPPLSELKPEDETELEDKWDSEHGSPALFDENYRLRPDSPLLRRLRSSR